MLQLATWTKGPDLGMKQFYLSELYKEL